MTRLITVLIVVVVLFCGYRLFIYWEKLRNEEDIKQKEAAAAFRPGDLPGLPQDLEAGLQTAQQKGPAAVQAWLKTHGNRVHDPRKAWIELEYAKSIARDNPAEARQVFVAIKNRTPPASPLWPQLKALEKTFQ